MAGGYRNSASTSVKDGPVSKKHHPSPLSLKEDDKPASNPPPPINAMYRELHDLMKEVNEARSSSEELFTNINKVHDKVRQENKLTQSHKGKLQRLYVDALEQSKEEATLVGKTLDKISAIRAEILENEKKARLQGAGPRNIEDMQQRKAKGMPKGVLMNIIQQKARDIPVWTGSSSDSPPPLCGCVPAEEKYKAKPDNHVAAHVTTKDGEDQWILAVVVIYNSHHHKYTVYDIDDKHCRYQVNRRRVIPLPLYKADPKKHQSALFKKGQNVLALYPQTTCFYKAQIHELPSDVGTEYSVLFEDTTYPEGYSPPLLVPQRFVIPWKETRRYKT
jgi:SAGA-associated factor 29